MEKSARKAPPRMRYRSRTLLVLMAVAPPLLAWSRPEYAEYRVREQMREAWRRQAEELELIKSRRSYPYFQLDAF